MVELSYPVRPNILLSEIPCSRGIRTQEVGLVAGEWKVPCSGGCASNADAKLDPPGHAKPADPMIPYEAYLTARQE